MDYMLFKNIYDCKKIIGKGGTGIVKEWCINNCYDKQCNQCSKSVIKEIRNPELDIQRLIKFFRIMEPYNIFPKLYKCYKYKDTFYIIMEYINEDFDREKIELNTLIHNSIYKLSKIHEFKICHRDLNTRNIIIVNNDIFFIDVDSCHFIESDRDIINDIKTLCISILSKFGLKRLPIKLPRQNIMRKIPRSISKIEENKHIISSFKTYVEKYYPKNIFSQISKESLY